MERKPGLHYGGPRLATAGLVRVALHAREAQQLWRDWSGPGCSIEGCAEVQLSVTAILEVLDAQMMHARLELHALGLHGEAARLGPIVDAQLAVDEQA